VVGTGVLWGVSPLCAVVPPPGLYGVVGTGVLWGVSPLCAVVPPPGLYGVVGTGVLWGVSTLCAAVPPPGVVAASASSFLNLASPKSPILKAPVGSRKRFDCATHRHGPRLVVKRMLVSTRTPTRIQSEL
jgi:hypothetical protein